MAKADWEPIPGYQCPAYRNAKDTRLPYCDNCESFATTNLSEFFIALDGNNGVTLICTECVKRVGVNPAFRIVRYPPPIAARVVG